MGLSKSKKRTGGHLQTKKKKKTKRREKKKRMGPILKRVREQRNDPAVDVDGRGQT